MLSPSNGYKLVVMLYLNGTKSFSLRKVSLYFAIEHFIQPIVKLCHLSAVIFDCS